MTAAMPIAELKTAAMAPRTIIVYGITSVIQSTMRVVSGTFA
jgi:hypothetical protein